MVSKVTIKLRHALAWSVLSTMVLLEWGESSPSMDTFHIIQYYVFLTLIKFHYILRYICHAETSVLFQFQSLWHVWPLCSSRRVAPGL